MRKHRHPHAIRSHKTDTFYRRKQPAPSVLPHARWETDVPGAGGRITVVLQAATPHRTLGRELLRAHERGCGRRRLHRDEGLPIAACSAGRQDESRSRVEKPVSVCFLLGFIRIPLGKFMPSPALCWLDRLMSARIEKKWKQGQEFDRNNSRGYSSYQSARKRYLQPASYPEIQRFIKLSWNSLSSQEGVSAFSTM